MERCRRELETGWQLRVEVVGDAVVVMVMMCVQMHSDWIAGLSRLREADERCRQAGRCRAGVWPECTSPFENRLREACLQAGTRRGSRAAELQGSDIRPCGVRSGLAVEVPSGPGPRSVPSQVELGSFHRLMSSCEETLGSLPGPLKMHVAKCSWIQPSFYCDVLLVLDLVLHHSPQSLIQPAHESQCNLSELCKDGSLSLPRDQLQAQSLALVLPTG